LEIINHSYFSFIYFGINILIGQVRYIEQQECEALGKKTKQITLNAKAWLYRLFFCFAFLKSLAVFELS
jgi:hypothetical protein